MKLHCLKQLKYKTQQPSCSVWQASRNITPQNSSTLSSPQNTAFSWKVLPRCSKLSMRLALPIKATTSHSKNMISHTSCDSLGGKNSIASRQERLGRARCKTVEAARLKSRKFTLSKEMSSQKWNHTATAELLSSGNIFFIHIHIHTQTHIDSAEKEHIYLAYLHIWVLIFKKPIRIRKQICLLSS